MLIIDVVHLNRSSLCGLESVSGHVRSSPGMVILVWLEFHIVYNNSPEADCGEIPQGPEMA